MVVKVIRELMRRNPKVKPEMIEENAWGVFCQEKDQGLTLGRTSVILAGLPETSAGFSIDRMCAGGMSAITDSGWRDRSRRVRRGHSRRSRAHGSSSHGRHGRSQSSFPHGQAGGFQSAMSMGETAENLHDMFPEITKEMTDEYSLLLPAKGGSGRSSRARSAR